MYTQTFTKPEDVASGTNYVMATARVCRAGKATVRVMVTCTWPYNENVGQRAKLTVTGRDGLDICLGFKGYGHDVVTLYTLEFTKLEEVVFTLSFPELGADTFYAQGVIFLDWEE